MSTADAFIDALSAHHKALVELVESYTPEDLRGASACTEWDKSQVLSHLGSAAVIARAQLEATLAATETTDDNEVVWARWNGMTPDERRAEFVEADGALVSLYESLDAAQRDDVRFKLAFLPEPVDLATLAGFRLNEVTLHRWDLEVMSDHQATLDPASVGLIFDRVPMFVGYIGKVDRWGLDPIELAVETTEPERRLGLSIGESVAVSETPADPGGVLRLPAEAWLRLVFGRLQTERTPAGVSIEGPVTLDDLRRVFPGM